MDTPTPDPEEPVWSYKGYRLKPSDFTSAMVHLYRAYATRSDVWRQRLDSTTNWAVVTTAAAISITFSDIYTSPVVISLCTILVTLFLWIETRRYRYFELWSLRVRLLETDFYAAMLVPPFHPDPMWAENLARSLLDPQFPVSTWEAFGRRYRHNYVWIYVVLGLAWIIHVWVHPFPTGDWSVAMKRAALGEVPGEVVLGLGVLFNGALLAVGLYTMRFTQAAGEVLDHSSIMDFLERRMLHHEPEAPARRLFRPRPESRRAEFLVLLVSRQGAELGRRMLMEVNRGVTAMKGTGMYTGKDNSVLLCALTITELERLKRVVKEVDSNALVVTVPVRDIRGTGFQPLE